MKSLPNIPSHDSVQEVLSQLSGTDEQKAHIQYYIDMLHRRITHLESQLHHGDSNFAPQPLESSPSKAVAHTNKQKILIIEDDLAINGMLKIIVDNAGYVALSAETGQEGIALAIEAVPDLIICDIHLPGMHGLDVIRAFKSSAELEDVPIIMLTADLFKADESYDIGVKEYLHKPIRKNQLLSYIHKYLPANP